MLVSVVNLKCSNCGESLSEAMARCPSCNQPVVIKKASSLLGMTPSELDSRRRLMDAATLGAGDSPFASDADFTSGCCLMRLKMFDQALIRFDKVLSTNPSNADAFFCAAIAVLKGKRPFLAPLSDVRRAQAYLDAAKTLEARGVFLCFIAYTKQDFYERRCLRVEPNWRQEMRSAVAKGLTLEDMRGLFALLGQQYSDEFLT